MKVEGYIKLFKEWMQAKGMCEASSIETYCSGVRTLLYAFENESNPKGINHHQLITFLGTIKSPHTRKSIYYSARLFYDVIIHQPNKFDNIPPPDIPESLPVILTIDEVQRMIDSKRKNKKHQTLLQFMYSGALRVSEPVSAKQSDISKQFDPILGVDVVSFHIHKAKGDVDRIINLPMETYNMIEDYKLHEKPFGEYLFNGWKQNPQYTAKSIWEVFQQAKKACGITKDITPHSFRHSMATHLLDAGFSLAYLMEFLGHKDIRTTMIYVHCSKTSQARMLNKAYDYIRASATRIESPSVMPLISHKNPSLILSDVIIVEKTYEVLFNGKTYLLKEKNNKITEAHEAKWAIGVLSKKALEWFQNKGATITEKVNP